MDRLLGLQEALTIKTLALDHDGQVGYFVECVLGGIHGLGIGDLLAGMSAAGRLGGDFAQRLTDAVPLELEFFLQATSLDETRYRKSFTGIPTQGLQALFG